MIIGPFFTGYLVVTWTPFLTTDAWNALPIIVTEPYQTWAKPVIVAIISCYVALFVASLLLPVLFFKRRTSAPYFFVAVWWLDLIFAIAVVTWSTVSGMDSETLLAISLVEIIRDGIAGAIWTAYMIRSRRVKATFRNRLSKADTRLPQVQQAAARRTEITRFSKKGLRRLRSLASPI